MSVLQVIARYTIAPGNEATVYELLPQLAEASRTEPGNLSYEAFAALDDPSNVVILERYDSEESFAAHRETSHFQEIGFGKIIPLLENRVIETYPVADPS